MWLKKHSEITQYIPQDGKFHDVQIVNNSIYVDGELKNPKPFTEIKIFSRLLNDEEILNLFEAGAHNSRQRYTDYEDNFC